MRRGRTFIGLTTNVPDVEMRKPERVIGVDRGAYNPAVTSNNQFFNSKKLRAVKGRYQHLKRCLQRAGTRSAKRHLMKLSGRERRFVADTNHCISKAIVNSDCDAIALEDLSVAAMKMRKRRGKGKKNARLIGNWSPSQLLYFIQYKARLLGKSVILVNSHYTSQACNKCGDIRRANRLGRTFKCKVCDFSLHSDLNAARNIACLAKRKIGRLSVNQPIVACGELKALTCDVKTLCRDELRASIVTSSAS